MAEASQENTTLDTRTGIDLVQRIFRLIKDNSLDEIKEIFETLQPEQRIKVLNSSINNFIPLYEAINHNNVEIARYLLKLSLRQGRRELSEHWKHCEHPLIAAIEQGNPKLIVLILLHLSHINDTISGPLTPLMLAIFFGKLTYVKLIIAMGADVNQPSWHGRIPLMYSTFNSEMCRFLLSRGAKLNCRGEEGFTALHLAATWNHKESVNHLIDAGADVRIRTNEGMNPLIWAAINLNMDMVFDLGHQPGYSVLDRIEALEILNACYVCSQKSYIESWAAALDAREMGNIPKNCQVPMREILDFSQEFTTETELENLQGNPLLLAFQGILVVERILGRNNRLYLQFLLQTALIAKQENNTEKVRQLIDYIQEFYEETTFVAANSQYFKRLFTAISETENSNDFFLYKGFAIFKIIAQSAVKMWILNKEHISKYPSFVDSCYSNIVDTFLYMTSKSNTLISIPEYFGEFTEEVERVVDEDLRVLHYQSILHRAVKLTEQESWASVELITVLLEAGADVKSKDNFGKTPVIYALKHAPQNMRYVILLLFDEYGYYSDCSSAIDFTSWGQCPYIKEFYP